MCDLEMKRFHLKLKYSKSIGSFTTSLFSQHKAASVDLPLRFIGNVVTIIKYLKIFVLKLICISIKLLQKV